MVEKQGVLNGAVSYTCKIARKDMKCGQGDSRGRVKIRLAVGLGESSDKYSFPTKMPPP